MGIESKRSKQRATLTLGPSGPAVALTDWSRHSFCFVPKNHDRRIENAMARCETCGNDYDKSLLVTVSGGSPRTFDSFECAIQALAPSCSHCNCRIIGHGVEAHGKMYCCAHCARQSGERDVRDRA